ncbi:MAG: hypothetical protein WKH64_16815 [Chloroflexia bacterium]
MSERIETIKAIDRALSIVLTLFSIAVLVEFVISMTNNSARGSSALWFLLGVTSCMYGAERMYFRQELAELAHQDPRSGRRTRRANVALTLGPHQIFRGGLISFVLGLFVMAINWPGA